MQSTQETTIKQQMPTQNHVTERTETSAVSAVNDTHNGGVWDMDRIVQSVLAPHQSNTTTAETDDLTTSTSIATTVTRTSHTAPHTSTTAHNAADIDRKTSLASSVDDDAKCTHSDYAVPSEYYGHTQHQQQHHHQPYHNHPYPQPPYLTYHHDHTFPTIPPPSVAPTPTPTSTTPQQLQPKHGNHAKGNFYISKEMISQIMTRCQESFRTDCVEEDEKLLFSYYKESVAMQINDEQLYAIATAYGAIIIINIDLHFSDGGEIMYLIASENDCDFVDRIKWKISALLTRAQVYATYGGAAVVPFLPRGSRTMDWFKEGMRMVPTAMHVRNLDLHHLNKIPIKNSKRKPAIPAAASTTASVTSTSTSTSVAPGAGTGAGDSGRGVTVKAKNSNLSLLRLRQCIRRSFRDATRMIPAVVIKGKKQWIEWKKFVQVYEDVRTGPGREPATAELIAISLRFHGCNQQWKIACIDYDVGRVYYQHRLCSLPPHHPYTFRYEQYIATLPKHKRRQMTANTATKTATAAAVAVATAEHEKTVVANTLKVTKSSTLNKHAVEFVPRQTGDEEAGTAADKSTCTDSESKSHSHRTTTVKQALSMRGGENNNCNFDNEMEDIVNGIVFGNVHDIDTFEHAVNLFGAITH